MTPFYRFFLLLCLLAGVASQTFSQQLVEICDNGIDDDGDGRIDLNDPDCDCPPVEPVSLIPNPSFEDRSCCPNTRSQMNCADTWIQASDATTDYLHTCGWMGWPDLPPPLPFPDGNACVGFRDGTHANFNPNPQWKEYTGACLLSPLRAGITYTFQFYIGFTHPQNSPPINVTFFGSTDCNTLPFGIGNQEFGCPTNGPGWKNLGQVFVRGANSWQQVSLTITPDEDIHAVAIGPDCPIVNTTENTYYFFDNLILAAQSAFEFQIRLSAHPCAGELTLELPQYDSLSYQWYKNGIALIGETGASMSRMYGNGNYQAQVEGPLSGCRITPAYVYEKPVYYAQVNTTICEEDAFFFDNRFITQPGNYTDTLRTIDGCDSIVGLVLDVFYDRGDTVHAKIFPTEYYELGGRRYYQPREYEAILQSRTGCDSTVHLFLDFYDVYIPNAFSPNDDGINDVFTIMGSEDLVSVRSLKIFNRWGNVVFEGKDLTGNDVSQGWDGRTSRGLAPEGVYIFTASIVYNDGKERLTSGSVTLIR